MDSFLYVISKPNTIKEAMASLGVCPKCGHELNFVGAYNNNGQISLYGKCENIKCYNINHSYVTGITIHIDDVREADL